MVRLAAQFKSNIFITYNGTRINAKSIMGLMMLAVEKGGKIIVEASGSDEKELMEQMVELVSSGFGEP
jgi:phosphocarrier protein